MTRNQKALGRYIDLQSEIGDLIDRIKQANDNHYDTDPDDVHFGHVGDLADIRSKLQELSDQIHREGEYAPENTATRGRLPSFNKHGHFC